MLQNVLVLLLANTLIPLLPVPPELFSPLPLIQIFYHEPTAFDRMNLSRIHTDEDFKNSFRQSRRRLHPDKGGSQEDFLVVQNLKQVMEHHSHYYDSLNITDVNLRQSVSLRKVASTKQSSYLMQVYMHYMIVMLYSIAFTVQEHLRGSRKFLLPIIFLHGGYELFIHYHPGYMTVFDVLDDKLPIFIQKNIIKNLLSVMIAVVLTRYSRKLTPERRLLLQVEKQEGESDLKDTLSQLCDLYKRKLEIKAKKDKSWMTKLRRWIPTALFLLFTVPNIISLFIPGGLLPEL